MIPIPILGFLEDTEKAALHCRMFCGFFLVNWWFSWILTSIIEDVWFLGDPSWYCLTLHSNIQKVSTSIQNYASPSLLFSLVYLWYSICLFNIPAQKNVSFIYLILFSVQWQFGLHCRHSTVTCGVLPFWRCLHWQTTHPSHPAQKGAENRVLLCTPHSQPGNRRNKSYCVSTECLQPRGLRTKGAAFIFQLVGYLMLAKYLLGMI